MWIWKGIDREEDPCFEVSLKGNSKKEASHAEISNRRLLASFNINNIDTNKEGSGRMIVPGLPYCYTPWDGGQLRKEADFHIIDANSLLNPKHPLDSLIRSVDICKPDYDWSAVHLLTDRANLRQIFEAVEQTGDKPFRIDAEMVGSTVCLTRAPENPCDYLPFATYNNNFYEVSTEPIEPGYDNVFRCVAEIDFAGLRLLVRYQVDCAEFDEKALKAISDLGKEDGEELDSLLAKLDLGSDEDCYAEITRKPSFCDGKLPVEMGKIVKLGTCGVKQSVRLSKLFQIFFSVTDKLVVGRHWRGNVKEIEEMTVEEVEDKLYASKQETIDEFARVMTEVTEKIRSFGEGNYFSLIWHPSCKSELLVYRREENDGRLVAPEKLLKKTLKASNSGK